MDRSAIMLLQVVVKHCSFNLLHPSTPSVVNELSTVLESLVYFADLHYDTLRICHYTDTARCQQRSGIAVQLYRGS